MTPSANVVKHTRLSLASQITSSLVDARRADGRASLARLAAVAYNAGVRASRARRHRAAVVAQSVAVRLLEKMPSIDQPRLSRTLGT